MVRLQQLTGMRPGEVVVMRGIDLDASGKVWLYRPGSDLRAEGQHKTAHHGHQRIIAIGPQAQGVLRPWLRLNVQEYLFQPREAREQMDAERKASRKTPFTPSQAMRKRKSRPKRVLQERYTTASYGKAIARDIERANYTRLCDGCKEALKARRKAEGKSAQIDPCAGCHPALVQ
jgi:integrase